MRSMAIVVFAAFFVQDTWAAQCQADVGFVVDVSGSLYHNFTDEMSFIKQLGDVLGVSEGGVHAGVVLYSDTASMAIPFSDGRTAIGFKSTVDALECKGGKTRIDYGLNVAWDELFQTSNGMRESVPKSVIVLTDGECNPTCEWRDSPPGRRFREAGIRVIVVAIGTAVNKGELLPLVADSSDFHNAIDFRELVTTAFVTSIFRCADLQPKPPKEDPLKLTTGKDSIVNMAMAMSMANIVNMCQQLLAPPPTAPPPPPTCAPPPPPPPPTSTTACPGAKGNMSPCFCYGNVCLGGGSATEGNVFVNQQPICDDHWIVTDAMVVCRQIGLNGGTQTTKARYGNVVLPYIMDDVKCTGDETDIMSCPHNDFHNCGGNEAAGVVCTPSGWP